MFWHYWSFWGVLVAQCQLSCSVLALHQVFLLLNVSFLCSVLALLVRRVFLLFNVSFLCSVLALLVSSCCSMSAFCVAVLALLVFLGILVAQCQLSCSVLALQESFKRFLLLNVSFLCSVLALLVF